MLKVTVCVGSSCHLKGSYDVIEAFKSVIAEKELESKVELAAGFCLGRCQDGVTIKVDEDIVTGLNKDNAIDVFEKEVMSRI